MTKLNTLSVGSLFVLSCIIIILSSCAKTIDETHPEFIGFWQGNNDLKAFSIRINPDGRGKYSYTGDGQMGNFDGRIRIKNERLIIGTKRLKINLFPFSEADGFIYMNIDGVSYKKID